MSLGLVVSRQPVLLGQYSIIKMTKAAGLSSNIFFWHQTWHIKEISQYKQCLLWITWECSCWASHIPPSLYQISRSYQRQEGETLLELHRAELGQCTPWYPYSHCVTIFPYRLLFSQYPLSFSLSLMTSLLFSQQLLTHIFFSHDTSYSSLSFSQHPFFSHHNSWLMSSFPMMLLWHH